MTEPLFTRTQSGRPVRIGDWQTHPALPDDVARLLGTDLTALRDRPDTTILRDKILRRTLLVREGQHLLLVKEIKPLHWRARVRSWFRGRPATREWRWAWRFLDAGVPVPQPWAYRDGGPTDASWFIQEGLPDALDLYAFYAQRVAAQDANAAETLWEALAERLGTLLAQIHAAGADHPDLHPGNILCTGASPATLRLWLVDYHSVRRDWGPPSRYRTQNLARWLFGVSWFLSRAQVEDVLAAYCRHAAGPPIQSPSALADVLYARLPAFRRRRIRSRARRCLVPSGGFGVEQRPGYRLWHRRELTPDQILDVVERANAGALTTHKDRGKTVVRHGALTTGERVWVKTYRHDGAWKQLEAHIRRTYGLRGWYASERMRLHGFPVARALAYIEEWQGWRLRRSHLITAHVPHEADLDTLLFTRSRIDGDPRLLRRKRALIRQVAALVRALHATGVYHDDLSVKNFLVAFAGEAPRLCLVDVDSVTFPWWGLTRRRRERNLAQLTGLPSTITGRDRLRFYWTYLERERVEHAAELDCARIERLGRKTQRMWRAREEQARSVDLPGPHRRRTAATSTPLEVETADPIDRDTLRKC